METERITLNQRERDRMRVLHEVMQGHLTQREAGRRLRLTDRQVRRLLLRIGTYGDQAVIHGLRGRPSNRKFAVSFERKVLVRVGQRYADFGPLGCISNTWWKCLRGESFPWGGRRGGESTLGPAALSIVC